MRQRLLPVFERLKEALDAVLDAATPAGDSRDVIHKMRDAVVETRVASTLR